MTPTREPLDLEPIKKRMEAATPGPWEPINDGNQYIDTRYLPTAKCVGASRIDALVRPWNPHALLAFGFKPKEYETSRFLDADAMFIAHSRQDMPALVLEVEALRAEVERLRTLCFDALVSWQSWELSKSPNEALMYQHHHRIAMREIEKARQPK